MAYDAENRQISATDGVTHAVENYLYDGAGQRVEKTGPGGASVYVYDGFGQLAAEYSTAATAYPCATCYLSYDHLGTVRMVTDQHAWVIARHDYLPFGEEIGANTAGRNGQWGAANDAIAQKFTGQERDSETGVDYFNARYFGAALGRFTSPDPGNAGADPSNPQSWNGYAYVLGNPLGNVDPTGMDTCPDGSWASVCVTAQAPPVSLFWWFYMNGRFNLLATLLQQAQSGASSSGGGGAGGATAPTQPTPATSQPPKSGTNPRNLACSADVAINFRLGFIPGYNAAKAGGALLGINFNPVEAAFGYKSVITGLPSPAQSTAGAASAYSLYRWAVFDAAGGASALNRLTDLASRASFASKSASAQASMLGKISSLSNLSKIASSAGTVANLLNVASAGLDLYSCWSQP
jgi:RHS repeat-associated protein